MRNNNSSTTRPVIAVLNWNGLRDTLECLDSLERISDVSFDVIIVDNNSSETHTRTKLEAAASNSPLAISLLWNGKNTGFSGGVNTAIRHALSHNYTHIALINNDAIVDSLWLKNVMNAFERDTTIGIVTCCLLHKDGKTIDSTGELYSTWGLPFPRLRNSPVSLVPESGYVFGASGGASIYKRELFESVGLFDETFFAYYEDTDLSFRSQLSGWKVYFESAAVAYHTQGASSAKIPGFTVKQAIRNLPLLYIKNTPASLLLPLGGRFLFAYSLITLKAIIGPSSKQALIGWLQGFWLFWTHGIPQRLKIQRTNKVSSRHIDSLLWHDLPPDQPGLRKLLGRSVK